MAGYNPIAIANYFIQLKNNDSDRNKRNIYLTHILKFTYIAHGFLLAKHNQHLSNTPFEAWRYGPIIPTILFVFRSLTLKEGSIVPVGKLALDENGNQINDNFSKEATEMMEQVYHKYKKFPSSYLSERTHQKGTPWKNVYDPDSNTFNTISDDSIKKYYKDIEIGGTKQDTKGL